MRAVAALGLVVAFAAPAFASDPAVRTYAADFDRVWSAVEQAVQAEGWGIDDEARPLGLLVTNTRRVAGSDLGLFPITHRARMRLTVVPAGNGRTRVQIMREVLRRERVLWIERDEPVPVTDALAGRAAEERVLAAIARRL